VLTLEPARQIQVVAPIAFPLLTFGEFRDHISQQQKDKNDLRNPVASFDLAEESWHQGRLYARI
jgi:hypothetical protein